MIDIVCTQRIQSRNGGARGTAFARGGEADPRPRQGLRTIADGYRGSEPNTYVLIER